MTLTLTCTDTIEPFSHTHFFLLFLSFLYIMRANVRVFMRVGGCVSACKSIYAQRWCVCDIIYIIKTIHKPLSFMDVQAHRSTHHHLTRPNALKTLFVVINKSPEKTLINTFTTVHTNAETKNHYRNFMWRSVPFSVYYSFVFIFC